MPKPMPVPVLPMPKPVEPMPVDAAQGTTVFRQPSFLGPAEVHSLLRRIPALGLQPYTNDPDVDIDAKGAAVHCTQYLNTRGVFASQFSSLKARILDLVAVANKAERWGWPEAAFRGTAGGGAKATIRVAEHHVYMAGCPGLPSMGHYDVGSIATVDIMLEEAATGGVFQTVEAGGTVKSHGGFRAGDAFVFVATKKHRVSPITRGRRRVLVVEVWGGEERFCGHRCDVRHGTCGFVDGSDSGDGD